jgi:hypothetical protein
MLELDAQGAHFRRAIDAEQCYDLQRAEQELGEKIRAIPTLEVA